MSYTPSQQVLERYADVLINFALGGGSGVKRGDVVRIAAHESAKPLYVELHRAVWRAGAPRDRPLRVRRRRRLQPLTRLLRDRQGRTDRLLPGEVHARHRRSDRSSGQRAQRRRHARAGGRRSGADHAQRAVDEARDGLAHREGERGPASPGRSASTARRRWRPRPGSPRRSTGSRSSTPVSWTRRTRSRAGARWRPRSATTSSG